MEKKEKTREKEKNIPLDRIEILESKAEREEKEKKKNNVVIKGLNYTHNVEEDIKKLFKEKLQTDARINKIYTRNKGTKNELVVVEMTDWEQKQNIMTAKYKLKDTEVYIDNDLTWEERKIQREIRSIARAEKEKGKRVKIGYQKIIIGDEIYTWDTKEKGVTLKRKWGGRKESKND